MDITGVIKGYLSVGPADAVDMMEDLGVVCERDDLNAALAKMVSEGTVILDLDFRAQLAPELPA